MEYQAAQRIQIRSIPGQPNDLAYHEDAGDGTPLCGQVNRDWSGRTMHYAEAGPGTVTCARCGQIVDEHRRAQSQAEADSTRKAEEDAARAERVRKIRDSGRRLALPELDEMLRPRPDDWP